MSETSRAVQSLEMVTAQVAQYVDTHGPPIKRGESGLTQMVGVDIADEAIRPEMVEMIGQQLSDALRRNGATMCGEPEIPVGTEEGVIVRASSLALRGCRMFDLVKGQMVTRFDVLYG